MLKEALEQSGIAGLIGWTDNHDEQDNVFQRALATALYPFQLLISPTAVKAYLTTILFLTTSFILLSISTTAYAFFYYSYIPQTDLERPIYLQYGADSYPKAIIPLKTNTLISQQPYEVNIILHMPRDPINLAAGNFMLDLTLHNSATDLESTVLQTLNLADRSSSTALQHSRRSAIMPYASTLNDLVSKLIYMPLHILSFHDNDSVTLTVPMFEEVIFARGKNNLPTHAELEIQTQRPPTALVTTGKDSLPIPLPQLHVYSARLTFQVRFHGLRYLVYNHRILAFAIFTTLFYTISISTLAIAWAIIAMVLSSSTSDNKSLVKIEPKIKQEAEASDPLRNTSDYKSDPSKTPKRITDESENETVNLRENWSAPAAAQTEFTPQTSEGASAASQDLPVADVPAEQADDEEEESEDEIEQYERIRKRMEYEARQRQLAMQQHDSGLGTSMESERSNEPGLVRRSSSRRNRKE